MHYLKKLLIFLLFAFSPTVNLLASERSVKIGSSIHSYDVSTILCNLINIQTSNEGLSCKQSIYQSDYEVLNALTNGDIDIGLSQSFLLNSIKEEQQDKLEFVMSFYNQSLNILVKDDRKIKSLDDLHNAVIDVGEKDSSSNIVFNQVITIKNWETNNIIKEHIGNLDKKVAALCGKKVDASVIYSGTPNIITDKITKACRTHILSIDDNLINGLGDINKSISPIIINSDVYVYNDKEIKSFGSPLFLLTSKGYDEAEIMYIVTLVLDHVKLLKKLHHAFSLEAFDKLFNNPSHIVQNKGSKAAFQKRIM